MVENTNDIKNLLQNVANIQEKYDEIAKITGENFNIFSVIKMESKEVRTHSAFIGELLNPKGSHGLKDVPLKILIKLISEKFNKIVIKDGINQSNEGKFDLKSESAVTTVEKYIGFTNEDKTEGGRIDIIIEDNYKKAIIIENKIYAIEQTNQLNRYHNYSKKTPILYLTLEGDSPTSAEGLEENNHYFNISYKEDIKKWLELCLKEAVEKPMLREVIKQYIYLIKKLTGQTINKEMRTKIVEKMEKEIEASFEIANNISELKKELYYNFFEKLNKYAKENGMKYEDQCLKNSTEYGIYLTPNNWDLKLYQIGVFFEADYSGLYIGLWYGKNEKDEKTKIKEKFSNKDPRFESNDYWIWKNPINCNWKDNPEIWKDVSLGENGQTYKEIIELIEEIITIEKS
jgi:hypothetical protein